MPRLWTETIEEHRRAVHDATLDATAALVRERGLASVTMSQIAAAAGIGRATLYKYFPDVEAVLQAWHERHISGHLDQLAQARDRTSGPSKRLEAVLQAYAQIAHESHRHHGTEIAAILHRGDHVVRAQQHLHDMIRDLIAEAAQSGDLRDDIGADELATYCLHALTAAGGLRSKAAVHRLVEVTLTGLQAPH